MRISRDGFVPQIEPQGRGRRWMIRLGGAKRLFQRAGGFVMQPITMLSAMTGAWATYEPLRAIFLHSAVLFFATAAFVVGVWMLIYYVVILSSEQRWGQTQSQRAERSPLKSDTEQILAHLEGADRVKIVQDGGSEDDA